ncbi:vimentin-like isoform X10 [Cimex lectularius]|uniref:Uncharacterized protein n=1 Tax=Cimex lectularius TaxID=79782 RepID=A0A8I6S239_CIMLE|nr:vimentin-like isoform X10 [Cimex lectularius]XP_014255635.1 vimentin-like isoform X10 [Cimex lectularius]
MDNTISPAMQKKLQEIAELQNILTNKLNEFAKLNENPKEIEEESLILRTELEEIKQISSTDSEETDREIEEKLKVVNERIERIAKAAIKAQAEAVKKSKKPLQEMREIVKKIIAGIQELEISLELKTDLIENATLFLTMAEQRVQSVKECLTFLEEALKESSQTEQITKENLNFRIDDFLNTMESLYPSQGKKIKPAGKNIKKGQKH